MARQSTRNQIFIPFIFRACVGLLLALGITGVFSYFHASEISTELANRLLSNYGVNYTNIVVKKISPGTMVLSQANFQGAVDTQLDESRELTFNYNILAKDLEIRFGSKKMMNGRVTSAIVQEMEIIISPRNYSNSLATVYKLPTDDITTAELFIEHWRRHIPLDDLQINKITISFDSNRTALQLTTFPLTHILGSLSLTPKTLLVSSVAYMRDRSPTALRLNTQVFANSQLQISTNDTLIFDLTVNPKLARIANPPINKNLQDNSQNKTIKLDISGYAELGFVTESLLQHFGKDNLGKGFAVTGRLWCEGAFEIPHLLKDLLPANMKWSGNSHFDLEMKHPRNGIKKLIAKGRLDSTWANQNFTAHIKGPLRFELHPIWSELTFDSDIFDNLHLSDDSILTGQLTGNLNYDPRDNGPYSFDSNKPIHLSIKEPESKTEYIIKTNKINAYFLNEFILNASFELSGYYEGFEIPTNHTNLELKQTDTHLFVEFTNRITAFDCDTNSQLLIPFDSDKISFKSRGSLKNIINLRHYLSAFNNIPSALTVERGTILLSLTVQGSDKPTIEKRNNNNKRQSNIFDIVTLDKQIALTLIDASFMLDSISAEGVYAKWELAGKQFMTNITPADLFIDYLDIGFPLTNTIMNFHSSLDVKSLFNKNVIKLDINLLNVKSHLLGGTISNQGALAFSTLTFNPFPLTPTMVDATAPEIELILKADNLQLTQILSLYKTDTINRHHSVSGTLPLRISRNGVNIENVALGYSDSDKNQPLTADQLTQLNNAKRIIENFQFIEPSIDTVFKQKNTSKRNLNTEVTIASQ